ncbi:Uncharacterized protein TCM_026966 [Theobroma cacao]|uniref:Hydroxyproline-rich glycoprotein family protein n=1 Tax=Theobroma cacao TaxID=3641 RepID=A0A061G6T9_THECC|nr:Uncharacterized protein TCM_026966 [Theobroma cacao]
MAFSLNLLHFHIIFSLFLLCSASRPLPKHEKPLTVQFGADSVPSELSSKPNFATPGDDDSVLPTFPFFQDSSALPPPASLDTNYAPTFPFPSLPSLPQLPPFPFILTLPLSSPVTPSPPSTLLAPPSEVPDNP